MARERKGRTKYRLQTLDMPNRRPEKTETFTFTDRFRALFGTLAGGGGVLTALTRFLFPGYGGQSGTAGGGFFNLFGGGTFWKGKRVDLYQSAPVVATLNWISRTFVEASFVVMRKGKDGAEQVPNHPLFMILKRPNEVYSWSSLFQAIIVSLYHDGNAYLLKKRREKDNAVIGLYFVPHWMIEPQWPADGSVFISHYIYSVNGKNLYIRPEDVIHIRKGLDPANTRKGFGVLKTVIKEVFTDDAASNFTAWMLDNYAIPGVIITPDQDNVDIDEDDAEDMKLKFMKKFGGERLGEPMFLTYKAKVQTIGHNPKDLALKEIRRIPEERVAAVTGVPAIVANLGAGLDASTYNNLENLKRSATYQTLVPLWRDVAEQFTNQLLVDFSTRQNEFLDFDTSQVKELKEDASEAATRTSKLFQTDIITRAEARVRVGEKVDPARDGVFFSEIRAAMRPAVLPGQTAPGAEQNGGKGLTGGRPSRTGNNMSGLMPFRMLSAGAMLHSKAIIRDLEIAAGLSEDELTGRLDSAFRQMADAADALAHGEINMDAPDSEARRMSADILGEETGYATPAAFVVAALLLMQNGSNESVRRIVASALSMRVDQVWTAEVELTVLNLQSARRSAYMVELKAQSEAAIAQAIRDIKAGKTTEEIADRIASMVSGRAMYPGIYTEAFEVAKTAGASDATAATAAERAARKYRAQLIAETETVTAQNIAALETFAASGKVKKVKVTDGDGCGWRTHNDPDKAHNTERSVEDARQYALAHPRCRRRFEPIIDDAPGDEPNGNGSDGSS